MGQNWGRFSEFATISSWCRPVTLPKTDQGAAIGHAVNRSLLVLVRTGHPSERCNRNGRIILRIEQLIKASVARPIRPLTNAKDTCRSQFATLAATRHHDLPAERCRTQQLPDSAADTGPTASVPGTATAFSSLETSPMATFARHQLLH